VTGPGGATATFSATATDGVDGTRPVTCLPASGTTFALGVTTVTCTATDAHGNAASGTFTVTVQDTTPPMLTLPAAQTAEATSAAGAAVTFTATAVDLVDGAVTVGCTPGAGTPFALGTTMVACTATDAHGNAASGSFTVTVADTTPPAITVPATLTVEATDAQGAEVTYPVSVADLVDPAPMLTCTPASGTRLALGTTHVTCGAQDASGNHATATFEVKVVDTTPPALTCPANVASTSATVTYPEATATDAVSTPVLVYSQASGTTYATGATTVVVTATDAAGNAATCSFTVDVESQAPDAGAGTPDGGMNDTTVPRGCGCDGGLGASPLALLMLSVVITRARRRRTP
jgi:hypothetical protein